MSQPADQAEQCFEAALTFNPNDTITLTNLAGVYQERQDLPRALATYERIVAINPDMADAWVNMASALMATAPQRGELGVDEVLHCIPYCAACIAAECLKTAVEKAPRRVQITST